MRPLIVLRPEPGATATCDAAKTAGLEPKSLPLFRIEPIGWQAPDVADFDGLLLTSANAVRQSGAQLAGLRGLPVYAVGSNTASEVRAAGFAIASVGSGGIEELLQGVQPGLRLLHLCGEQRREPAAPRQSITPLPVYRAAEIDDVDVSPIAGAVVAIHSPRAGARLAELAARTATDISRTAVVALSREAAHAAGDGWEVRLAAAETSEAALLALAAPLCNTSAQG